MKTTIQIEIKIDEFQLAAYGEKCSLHIGLHLKDKFMTCIDSENRISLDDWYRWLSR